MNPASLSKFIKDRCSRKSTSLPEQHAKQSLDPVLTSCDPLLPTPLVRRYQSDVSGGSTPFKRGDYYSIDVQQGVMGTRLLEGDFLGKEWGNHGQFAVLANVFEFAAADASDTEKAARRFIQFGSSAVPPGSNPGLKLIYYSGDVQRRQPFNFSNIPLRARGTYSGNSVAIQLVVIEIDNVSAPVREMLSTLADFGQSALPGPTVAKDILLGLGKSLLSGSNHDDRLLEYRFVLSPASDATGGAEAIFAPGQYVIRRTQARGAEIGWGNVRLDQNTGRLFSIEGEPIRDDLYFTLNIKRYSAAAGEESYAAPDWDGFRTTLSDAADERDKPLRAILPDVQKLVIARRTDQWRSRIAQAWEAARARGDQYAAAIAPSAPVSPDPKKCAYHSQIDLSRNEQVAQREAQQAVTDFLNQYQSAATVTFTVNEKPTAEFAEPERMAVINAASLWFMPWPSDSARDSFKSVAAFEAAFPTKDGSDKLWTLAEGVIKSRSVVPADCDELIRRGFGYALAPSIGN